MAGFGRLDLFDRAMALAAQLISSVLPILIMLSVWVGQSTTEQFAEAVSMPPVAQDVLEQALDESGGSAFGIVGTVFLLLSATSLSRALTRAMASIWRLSRPKTQLTNAWRWVAVVVALALAAVVTSSLSRFTDPIPPRNAWTLVLTFGHDVLVAASVPWLLLADHVPMRRLIPGGVVFALAMLVVRPAGEAYLPRALENRADQFGSIGVAFTLSGLAVFRLVSLSGHRDHGKRHRRGRRPVGPVHPSRGADSDRRPDSDGRASGIGGFVRDLDVGGACRTLKAVWRTQRTQPRCPIKTCQP